MNVKCDSYSKEEDKRQCEPQCPRKQKFNYDNSKTDLNSNEFE